MPTVYRAEFFDHAMKLVAWAQVENAPAAFDYLTLDATTVTTNKALDAVSPLDLCRVVSADGTRFSGVVSASTVTDAGTSVTVKPLLALLDVTCAFDRTRLQTVTLEQFLAGILTGLYAGGDALQNLTGFNTVITSETPGAKLNLKDNVHNLYDILTSALKKYGVCVSMDFDPAAKTVTATIGKAPDRGWIIEADLPGCADVSVDFSDGLDGTNKLTLIDKNDETQRVTYYLHPDGSVDTSGENRITPVRFAFEYIDDEDFAPAAAERAADALKPAEYDNLIELTVLHTNRVVRWREHAIGEPVTVLYRGAQYKSVFTGWQESERAATLTFGAVRLELTKKLILERRRNA